MAPDSFGTQPPHYIKPNAAPGLLEARRKKDIASIENEKAKMSYVRQIFTGTTYVLVIYQVPVKQGNESNFRLQFYTLDGDFIDEIPIPGQPDRKMWFDKERHILYSLAGQPGEDGQYYSIVKYKISL